MPNWLDDAGDLVARLGKSAPAGYLTYNPGPGLYSRLEKAIEAMPENVRVQELPGLLKRYKEGVPGWELKATDLDSLIAGRDAVPRAELLARVKERSPVYATKEVRLERPPPRHMPEDVRKAALQALRDNDYLGFDTLGQSAAAVRQYPDWRNRWEVSDEDAVPLEAYRTWHAHPGNDYDGREIGGLGATEAHGPTRFHDYAGAGAEDYTELVFLQPGFGRSPGHHWHPDYPKPWDASPRLQQATGQDAVAHMRMASYGDALRLLESQSDVLNDTIKASPGDAPRQYAMQQAQVELDIKRLALEAARSGKRAIEIASPEYVARSVGMPLDHAQHRYGKVAVSELERLGRKMGGLTLDESGMPLSKASEENPAYAYHQNFRDQMREATGEDQLGPNFWRLYSGMRYDSLPPSQQAITYDRFGGSHPVSQSAGGTPQDMYEYLHGLGLSPEQSQRITSQAIYLAPHNARSMHNAAVREQLESVGHLTRQPVADAPRRYIMSDEMRRRLIQEGVGAAIMAPMMGAQQDQYAPSP